MARNAAPIRKTSSVAIQNITGLSRCRIGIPNFSEKALSLMMWGTLASSTIAKIISTAMIIICIQYIIIFPSSYLYQQVHHAEQGTKQCILTDKICRFQEKESWRSCGDMARHWGNYNPAPKENAHNWCKDKDVCNWCMLNWQDRIRHWQNGSLNHHGNKRERNASVGGEILPFVILFLEHGQMPEVAQGHGR